MKSEMLAFNIKIKKAFVIQYPSKRWGFVGHVPVELAFVDATDEQLKNMQYGEKFGPKKRSFETEKDARDFANSLNIEVN